MGGTALIRFEHWPERSALTLRHCRVTSPLTRRPPKYGNWNGIYRRFRRWSEAGVWEAVLVTRADTRGRPLAFHLTIGEAADCKTYDALSALPERAPKALLADKGYDAEAIRVDLANRNIQAVRGNRIEGAIFRGLYDQSEPFTIDVYAYCRADNRNEALGQFRKFMGERSSFEASDD